MCIRDSPWGVAVDATTGTVYVTNEDSNTVSVIKEATDQVAATIPVGDGPQGVAVDAATDTVFVTNFSGDSVSVISGATNTVTATIALGQLAIEPNSVAVDTATGEPLVTSRGGTFIRGEGGFGGERGPRDGSDRWEQPGRDPDLRMEQPTRPEQALLYRLTGDRNPLHTDPQFAARGGFSRPILHGLCTYGVTGRALLHAVCGSDPARFGFMSGRFTRPVLPGETLVVSIWRDDGGAVFQTAKQDGTVVIDRGRMRVRS